MALFDSRASRYDESDFHRELARDAVRLLERPAGDVLDVGTGTGLALRALDDSAGVRSSSGVDVSRAMLDIARQHLPSATLVQASAENLPFDAGSFDAILCVAVLPYVQPRQAMKEWARVLRAGGQVVFTAHEEDGVRGGLLMRQSARKFGIEFADPNARTGTRERIDDLTRVAGLRVARIASKTYSWPASFTAAGFDLQRKYFPLEAPVSSSTLTAWRNAYVNLVANEDHEEHKIMLVRLMAEDPLVEELSRG